MDSVEKAKRAKDFSDQVESKLKHALGDRINFEGDRPPNLAFVIVRPKHVEMRLEYLVDEDTFLLYDKDQKTQKNETLGKFSPENITTPNDPTSQKVVDAVLKYCE